jgi:hypothetical protein
MTPAGTPTMEVGVGPERSISVVLTPGDSKSILGI